ncbi:MAG: galactokinase [Phycisphaeraceae bacterium]|nr:galactokinase [Phycisphaeraceae bacterium]
MTLQEQLAQLRDTFTKQYGCQPTHGAFAPGRVNLIGEHTDYNDGFVCPIAIERQTMILAKPNATNTINVYSIGMEDHPTSFQISENLSQGEPQWGNYVKGVIYGCLKQGINPGGFDAYISSTVPLGSGLSSSAALEVAVATLAADMAGQQLDVTDKALLCQKAEHDFANMPCGIMDQYISAGAIKGCAMLLDCQTNTPKHVKLADPSVSVLIINSNVKHQLSGSEYPQRREQCETAAKHLGVKSLRHATLQQLQAAKDNMESVVYKRALHVIGEIKRTAQAAKLMEQNAWEQVGKHMYDSHQTLSRDFEVSTNELDLLVELAKEMGLSGGVFGSRMTGGGFGGCTVSLVKSDKAQQISDHICKAYQRQTAIKPTAFVTRPAQGAHTLSL